VYGNVQEAGDWWGNTYTPDDVWIARYDIPPRATIRGLAHGLTSPDAITDTMWTNNQRGHQYVGSTTQKWGGLQLSIDVDIEAASVAGSQGSKSVSSFSFTTVDIPGAPSTSALGVNDAGGDLTGSTTDVIVGNPAFVDTNGSFTSLICPGGSINQSAYGVNNLGQVVGACTNADGSSSGFIYSGGIYTVFSYPGSVSTWAMGINDDGQIVGSYEDSSTNIHGFVYKFGGDATFTSFDFPDPNGFYTHLTGVNGQGQIVGYYFCPAYPTNSVYGFLWNHASDGSLLSINYPGATGTWPTGLNANGEVVGTSRISEFLWSNGNFSALPPVPNSCDFWPNGINNYGRVVGFWTTDCNTNDYQGFWAVPAP